VRKAAVEALAVMMQPGNACNMVTSHEEEQDNVFVAPMSAMQPDDECADHRTLNLDAVEFSLDSSK